MQFIKLNSKRRVRPKRLLHGILLSLFLLSLGLQNPSAVDAANYAHPQAVLSLSGTLGDNGWYTSDVEASLYTANDDSNSATTEYTLYNHEWTLFDEPFLIFEEGQTTIYYRVRNEATDYVGETKFSMVDIDKTPPTGTIIIDSGNTNTYSLTVTLTLSVTDETSGPTTEPPSGYIWGVPSGPSDIRFSNDGHKWSAWEPITEEKTWLLDSGGGTKTVYVQARDNAGLVSGAFYDTINLVTTKDNTAPTTRITVSGKQNSQGTYTSAVAVILNPIDDLSGVNYTEYSFDNSIWTKYTGPIPIAKEGSNIVYYRSHDAVGNVESANLTTIEIALNEENEVTSPILIFVIFGSISVAVLAGAFLVKRKATSGSTAPV